MLTEAARVCAESLGVQFCKVCRYRPGQNDPPGEAGVGWKQGVIGRVVSRADESSPQGRAFITGKPVICTDQQRCDLRVAVLLRRPRHRIDGGRHHQEGGQALRRAGNRQSRTGIVTVFMTSICYPGLPMSWRKRSTHGANDALQGASIGCETWSLTRIG